MERCCRVGSTMFLFGRPLVQISARRPGILTAVSRGCCQSLQGKARVEKTLLKLGHAYYSLFTNHAMLNNMMH